MQNCHDRENSSCPSLQMLESGTMPCVVGVNIFICLRVDKETEIPMCLHNLSLHPISLWRNV